MKLLDLARIGLLRLYFVTVVMLPFGLKDVHVAAHTDKTSSVAVTCDGQGKED